MIKWLDELFGQTGYMPHGHCYLWNPSLVATHVASDLLIGLAYVSISLSLYALIRKIKLPFSSMVLSFGVFIGACGATHFMEVWNLWFANYWLAGLVKVLTAAASVATGIWLVRLRPQILEVAEAAKLSAARSAELEQLNRTLSDNQKLMAHSAKMSALGEMAGGIAHEINSPLAIITVRANQLERLVQRGALTPEMIVTESKLIANTAKRIGGIIKGLRSFAREGEKDPYEEVTVESVVQDALILCQTRFESHAVALELVGFEGNPTIECRSVQIGQVVLNLLNNAFDAVHQLSEKWVRLELRQTDSSVELSITDSGKGIASNLRSRIMQPFFTTKEVGKGTGLGLSISKGIIENHGGKLELDSSSPNTRFVITLPIRHGHGGQVPK